MAAGFQAVVDCLWIMRIEETRLFYLSSLM